jgi:hypothetical protein
MWLVVPEFEGPTVVRPFSCLLRAFQKLFHPVRGCIQVESVFRAHRDVQLALELRTQSLPITLQQRR